MTVIGDSFSACAVSSTPKPPKNRNSQNACFSRIDLRQRVQGIIDGNELGRAINSDGCGFIQRDSLQARAALQVMPPRMVYEDAAHELSGDCKEVRPILPFHSVAIDQAKVHLVYQSGGLQRVPGQLRATRRCARRRSSS